jgi:hypothetical protein
MLHLIPLPELHLIIELIECVTHPFILGPLKFLNGYGFRHVIVYQTSPDVVTELLRDDVDGGG